MVMKTEQVIQRLTNEVEEPWVEHIALKKEDAKLVLERVKTLEGVIAELLRSQRERNTDTVLPYRPAPAMP